MLSLAQISTRRLVAAAPRIPATAAAAASTLSVRRRFSTSPVRPKTVTETAKDTLKSVDRAVSDKLVEGINMGSAVAGKVKEAGEEVTKGSTADKAADKAGEMADKAGAMKDKAGAKAQELKQDVQDKTRQAADQASDKAQQAASEVKKRV